MNLAHFVAPNRNVATLSVWGSADLLHAAARHDTCEPWGPFVDKSFSICLAKTLAEHSS